MTSLIIHDQLITFCIRWVEQDPNQLYSSVVHCIEGVAKQLDERGVAPSSVRGIGITNQRETTLVWDSTTGKCLYSAIGT